MRKLYIFLFLLFFVVPVSLYSQTDEIEITAQAILARVDNIMKYPEGEMRGRIKHISPDGKSYTVDFIGSIARTDFLFSFSNKSRGEELKVLYKMSGEDVWVYNNHALKLFHKMGIDKYDSLFATNFNLTDFSNSDFQNNYNARITGESLIKGVECYKLDLVPVFQGSEYGLVTLYASKDKYLPMRIDYHDRDKVVFKFLSLSRTMEKGDSLIPIRYDMLNIRNGTVTILNFIKFDEAVTFRSDIFRPETLGE
ncbi:MAG: outer membrane lipoprotein-sorting protein [Spirochaetota bacterium]